MPSLDTSTSKTYWRSYNDLADTPEFRQMVQNEFPSQLDAVVDPVSRRRFVQVMGASLALAGLTGCDFVRWPKEKILPFAQRPEGRDPGTPVQYATAIELGGVGTGLLVTSYDGRPIKVEGNAKHPESLGATTAQAQASILSLYDPDRSRTVVQGKKEGKASTWDAFWKAVGPKLKEHVANKGDKLVILSEAVGSPTLAGLRAQLEKKCPYAKWLEYEADDRDNELTGVSKKILGGAYRAQLDLTKADVIVSLDADLLEGHPASLRLAREFADRRRRHDSANRRSNRLYMAESTFSLTGGMADVRHAAQASEVLSIGLALAAEVVGHESMAGKTSAPLKAKLLEFKAAKDAPWAKFVSLAGEDLLEASRRGGTLVAVGAGQDPLLHSVAHLLNGLLGNVGSTVSYTKVPERPSYQAAIKRLAEEANEIETLLILGANPIYNAPADLEIGKALDRIALTVHLGDYRDETGSRCAWHVPRAHYLEGWADTRSFNGTAALMQPLILPLFGGVTAIEFVARALLGKEGADAEGYVLVREHWKQAWKGKGEFESLWRRALHDGVIPGASQPETPQRQDGELLKVLESVPAKPPRANKDALEVVFRLGKLHDGRFANNSWLQELPEPITKLTWDNAVWLSPETAKELGGVTEGDLVTLEAKVGQKSATLEVAAFVVPGLPKFTLSLALGYGRGPEAGVVAKGAGFNAYTLRGSNGLHVVTGVKLSKSGKRYDLATTQDHHSVLTEVSIKESKKRAGELIREASLTRFTKEPRFAKDKWQGGDFGPGGPDPAKTLLWKEVREYNGRKWGMAIDLSVCTGCSACVVACQAENNIPVVGKSEVARGREMHWLRIDRYFSNSPLDKAHGHDDDHSDETKAEAHHGPMRIVHQPMPCQQCENAPCESVCPVAATTHSEEGLNDMAYNRCIGTRYCSNNCPYKVRRFNYFYNHHGPFHPRSEPAPDSANYPKLPADSPLAIGPLEAAKRITKLEQMVMNPEVTVRSRGVMEKCTYCVQRIKAATIPADNAGEKITDGAVRTACQQVCPTQAIAFGDLNDKDSEVAKLHANDRSYTLLAELNVRARTHYLAKIRNTPEGMA